MKDDRRLLRLVIVVLAVVGTATTPGRTDAYGYDVRSSAPVSVLAPSGPEGSPVQPSVTWEQPISPSVEARGTSTTPAVLGNATNTAIGFTDDAVGSAYQGMRSGGGHAMRHLIDEGLIPNSGSLASRASTFQDLTSPILTNPSATFNWRLGDTATRAFAGQAGGRQVVVFAATEGPYQGRVISAVVPDASQVAQWGL